MASHQVSVWWVWMGSSFRHPYWQFSSGSHQCPRCHHYSLGPPAFRRSVSYLLQHLWISSGLAIQQNSCNPVLWNHIFPKMAWFPALERRVLFHIAPSLGTLSEYLENFLVVVIFCCFFPLYRLPAVILNNSLYLTFPNQITIWCLFPDWTWQIWEIRDLHL